MRILGLDEGVEILTSREDLARILRPIELAGIALDCGQLPFELGGDINHERRFHRVFTVGEGVQDLVRAVRLARSIVLGQAGEKAGISAQLGRDPVVRMATDWKGQNHYSWSEVPNVFDDDSPGLLAVFEMRVGQQSIAPLRHTQNLGGPFRFLASERCATMGAAFARGEVEDPGSIPLIHSLEEGAGAGELGVVPMRGDGEQVDGHGEVSGGRCRVSGNGFQDTLQPNPRHLTLA
jgi:hypothetical protein